ncbi:HlyC/CorC family transporter [Candidatus Micrarchaeota archaeon]|nr:HlyC/CorC family transporter [Candidatus Micrarchaeota archaeon]
MQLELLLFGLFLVLAGYFSAAEAALLSISRMHLRHLVKTRKSEMQHVAKLKANPARMIMTILIGSNVSNISAAFLAAYITTQYFGDAYLGLATGIVTLLMLIFGEIVPKSFATTHADAVAILVSPYLVLLGWLLSPIIFLLDKIIRIVPGTYPIPMQRKGFSEDELRSVIDLGVEERAISAEEKRFFERILDFNDTYIKEIMTPKKETKCVNISDSQLQALAMATKYQKNRFPALGENGQVLGTISIKLLLAKPQEPLQKLLEPAHFVSKEMLASDLFRKMQKECFHMAIVLDPSGNFDGIVTISDLVEELVGELENSVACNPSGEKQQPSIITSGETRLHALEKELNVHFKDSQRFGSIAAYVHYQLNRLPQKGDVVLVGSCRIEIKELGKDGRIEKIEVGRLA